MNWKKIKINWSGIFTGFLGGIIASLCCLTPLVLILLGLGSASFAFSFISLKPYFLLASLVFLGLAFWFHFRKKACSVGSFIKKPYIITALSAHLVIFLVSLYLLLPTVGSFVFEKKLFSDQTEDHSPSCHLVLGVASEAFNALSCTSCEAALKYKLEQQKGIVSAEVNLVKEKVNVHYDKQKISDQEIVKAIPKDFTVKSVKVDQC